MRVYLLIVLVLSLLSHGCKKTSINEGEISVTGINIPKVYKRAVWMLNGKDYQSSEPILSKQELSQFLDTLTQQPSDYYHRCLLQDSIPNLNSPNYEPKEFLSLKDFYSLFQTEYYYSYHGAHPFYLVSYKNYNTYTQFFICHYNDYSAMMYIIHMNPNGKTLFTEPIWSNGGDGGDYHKTQTLVFTKSKIVYQEVDGYFDGNEMDEPEEKIIEVTLFINENGGINKRLKKTIKNNYKETH